MLASIPRADRGAIWAAAEQIQRLQPSISAAVAFTMAIDGYEHGSSSSTAEQRIAQAVIDNPAAMFQTRRA
jgi:hypothetical protein